MRVPPFSFVIRKRDTQQSHFASAHLSFTDAHISIDRYKAPKPVNRKTRTCIVNVHICSLIETKRGRQKCQRDAKLRQRQRITPSKQHSGAQALRLARLRQYSMISLCFLLSHALWIGLQILVLVTIGFVYIQVQCEFVSASECVDSNCCIVCVSVHI